MNRFLQIINFGGAVALGILCVFQWQDNRHANLDGIRLETENHRLATKVAEQKKAMDGLTADLDTFRDQLTKASSLAGKSSERLGALENENATLMLERDQLKQNVVSWRDAVTDRDKQIAAGNETIKQLTAARDETIAKFNALAEKHNRLVKDFNEANRALAASRTNSAPAAK